MIISQNQQLRSKLKKKCNLYKDKSFNKLMNDRQKYLGQILSINYPKDIKPQIIKPAQLETYGCIKESQLKAIFQRQITRQILQKIIIDAMKLCYLYHPIMQAIQTQLPQQGDQVSVRDLLNLIMGGKFYQFLKLKTQQTKYLINNRNTEINVKTIVCGILTYFGNKLTIQNISDVILFYRLQEALYQTAPYGLPFEFEKIMKAIKKIDRNITSQNFDKWEKRINTIQTGRQYLQPYHFLYLISLSEPISKKKAHIFQVDRKESKFQKQTEMINIMKQKNSFIDLEKRKTHWKNEIKIRGLSFQQPKQVQKVNQLKILFAQKRKKIDSHYHQRTKSAHVQGEPREKAQKTIQRKLKKINTKPNLHFFDNMLVKTARQINQRTLLKKHKMIFQAKKQSQRKRDQKIRVFSSMYDKQLNTHLSKQYHKKSCQKVQDIHQMQDFQSGVAQALTNIVNLPCNESKCKKIPVQKNSKPYMHLSCKQQYIKNPLEPEQIVLDIYAHHLSILNNNFFLKSWENKIRS